MSMTPTVPRSRIALAAVLAALIAAGVIATAGAAPAAAAAWTCDASAVRGTLAAAPPFEPVTANRGAAACAPATAGGASALAALPVGLSGGGLAAATSLAPAQG